MNGANPESSGQNIQHRLYIINRSGSGEALYLLLTPEHDDIPTYQVKVDQWKATKDVSNFGVAVVDNILYIIGGFQTVTAKHLSRVMKYDPRDGVWTELELAPLPSPRAKFATAVLHGKILVLGGEKEDGRVTSTCFMFDPESSTWSESPPLVAPRANHSCMVHQNEIYCAGGYFGSKSHKNIWTYEGKRWEELGRPYPHHLPVALDRLAMTTVGRRVYFTGGVFCKPDKDDDSKHKFMTEGRIVSYTTSVSAMTRSDEDDQDEGLDDENKNSIITSDFISPWNLSLPTMKHCRHSHGIITLGSRIYIIGGSILETGQQVRIVEFFDTEKGEWEEDFRFRKGDVSNVTCAILEVPTRQEETRINDKLRWIMW